MKIADLFVTLGLKDSGNTEKSLKSVKGTLGDISTTALATKAAILAAMYGLEHMMSKSAALGTSLINFNALTGISAKTLQEWQFAARQAGVSGEELSGSMKAVQQSMANMLMGKGAPEGLALLANKVGFDPTRARDTIYVMEQLQEVAQNVPPDMAQAIMKSFGVSEGVMAGMFRNMFRPDVFKHAPMFSEGEIALLDKANIVWSNLGNKVQMAFGHLTAKHGLDIAKDFSKITDQVFRLADAFLKLSEKLKFFQALGKVFEGWGLIFSTITKGVSAVSDATKLGAAGGTKKLFNDAKDEVSLFAKGVGIALVETALKQTGAITPDQIASPLMKPGTSTEKTQNINVNQNLNFQHDGKDAVKTSKSVQKAVQDAYRQTQAQSQGS